MVYTVYDIYGLWVIKLNNIIETANNNIEGYRQSIKRYKEEVTDNISVLKNYSNYKVTDSFIENIDKGITFYRSTPSLYKTQVARLTVLFRNARHAIRNMRKAEVRKRKAKDALLSISEFTKILREFNLRLVDDMIKNGLVYNMPYRLGILYIERAKVLNPKVDWHSSNKKRQQIIDNGGTPYDKESAPDGEKWLIHHTNDYAHRFQWSRAHSNVTNKSYFMFIPTRNQNGNVSRMVNYIKSNPHVVHKYVQRKTMK